MSGDYRGKGRAVFLAAIMMLSVVMMSAAFAGSAAADVTSLENANVSNVTVGQETVTQTVQVDVTTDSGDENITIDPSSAASIQDSDLVSVDSATGSDNLTVQEFGIVSSAVEVNVTGNSSTDTPDGTLTVDYTLDTTGIATSSGESISVSEPDSSPVNLNFDLTAPDSITVATDNGNGLQYAVNNVAEDGTVTVESGVTYNGDLDIETEGITLEGPNAGVDGNSERAEEAVISGVVTAGQSVPDFGNITIDGFTIEATPEESREFPDKGVLMLSESGDLIGDNVIKNNIITVDGSDTADDGSVAGAYISGNSDLELTFRNNLFNDSESNTGTVTQAITQAQTPVSSVNVTDNTIKTEGSIWLQADGDVTGTISGNEFTDTITEQDAVRISQYGSGAVDIDILENEFNATYSTYIDQTDSGAIDVDISENKFNSEVAVGTQINGKGSGAVDVDIIENKYDISANNFGIFFSGNIDVGGSDSINISNNNFAKTSITAINADKVTGTIDATSNWYGATNGPSGDFNGNGSAVSGSATVDPATVRLDSGSVNLTQDFLGIVDDPQNVILSDTSDATFSFDSEPVPGEVDGTLVLEIGGTEFVFNDVLNEGEIDTTIGPDNADDSGKNGTSIALSAGTGDQNISVAGYDSTTAVEQAGTTKLIHVAKTAPNTGYFVTSMPQSGEFHEQGIADVTQYDGNAGANEEEYSSFDASNDVASVNRALFINAESADARYGYTFDTDRSGQQTDFGSVRLSTGWHVLGSNFNVSQSNSVKISTDLQTQTGVGTSDLNVYPSTNPDGTGSFSTDTLVSEYEAYYVYVHSEDNRPVFLPEYDPDADKTSEE